MRRADAWAVEASESDPQRSHRSHEAASVGEGRRQCGLIAGIDSGLDRRRVRLGLGDEGVQQLTLLGRELGGDRIAVQSGCLRLGLEGGDGFGQLLVSGCSRGECFGNVLAGDRLAGRRSSIGAAKDGAQLGFDLGRQIDRPAGGQRERERGDQGSETSAHGTSALGSRHTA
jgi:hypothetical protein